MVHMELPFVFRSYNTKLNLLTRKNNKAASKVVGNDTPIFNHGLADKSLIVLDISIRATGTTTFSVTPTIIAPHRTAMSLYQILASLNQAVMIAAAKIRIRVWVPGIIVTRSKKYEKMPIITDASMAFGHSILKLNNEKPN